MHVLCVGEDAFVDALDVSVNYVGDCTEVLPDKIYVCMCVCVCVCMYVCVYWQSSTQLRERERRESRCCVCVCVCEREREREESLDVLCELLVIRENIHGRA